MSPPISYYNTPWGRHNSDFDDASSRQPHRSSLTHAPAGKSESPPQSRSPSPKRGSISELPSTRVKGYGLVMKTAQEQGFVPPTRESVKAYGERTLPPTPTSVTSLHVEEMSVRSSRRSRGRKGSVVPTPTSSISAHEVLDEQGRVRAVFARRKRLLPPSPFRIVPSCDGSEVGTPPGSRSPVAEFEGRMLVFDGPSVLSSRSTVDSDIDADGGFDFDFEIVHEPQSPTWVRRVRKRAHWTLRWMECYRED